MTNTELLDKYYAAIKAGDAAQIEQCVDLSFELNWQGSDAIPWAGRWQGVVGLQKFFCILNQHLEVLEINRLHMLADDAVTMTVLEGHWRMKANGKDIRAKAGNVFTFKDGKIASYTVLNNSAAFADAMQIAK
jgi:uncharacterized protein